MAATTTTTLRFAVLLTTANGFLDAYTYITRGRVFANVQTGNVILFAIDLTHGNWGSTLGHLWPILAFLVGVVLSAHIRSGRVEKLVTHPMRWTMGIQALAFATVGFVPTTVPNSFVTVPISFLAAMQCTLFRSIGDLTYISVATTGNLMRVMEAGYSVLVEKNDAARDAFRVYAALTATFASGAVLGAIASLYWGIHAVWVPAALLAVTLVLFIIDERDVSTGVSAVRIKPEGPPGGQYVFGCVHIRVLRRTRAVGAPENRLALTGFRVHVPTRRAA